MGKVATKKVSKAKTTKSQPPIGTDRLYETLCRVLDALRDEAPSAQSIYHPPKGNHDAVVQARSRALLHLYLKARFGLTTHAMREPYITEGKFDGGVDAYYIDKSNKKIYLLQGKFRASAKNFTSTTMTPSDLLKMDVGRIMKGESKSEAGDAYNVSIRRLQREIQKLPDRGSYVHEVVLLGNSHHLTKADLGRLVEGYPVDQFPHQRIFSELMFPVINGTYFTDPELKIEINLDNLNSKDVSLDYDVSTPSLRANIKVLFAPTKEIGRIMSAYRNSLLKFNPRSFLELQRNPVNREIEASLTGQGGNEFAMFNNGITLIADKTAVSSDTATKGRAQVVVTNPQLVNGGQTAYTLGRVYSRGNMSVFKGKEVLVKIVSFVGAKQSTATDAARTKLIQDISRASNSQTRIDEADRRSNDQVQLDLQKAFFDHYGLYYERKRGEFSDGVHDGYIGQRDVLNREKLIRVNLACAYRVNQAKAGVAQFFREPTFSTLFNVGDISRYAFGYQVLQALDDEKAKPSKGDRWQQKKYGQALRYGEYAVVAACVNHGMKSGKPAAEVLAKVLSQWMRFEASLAKRKANAQYFSGGVLDGNSYYKGSTVNDDLKAAKFAL
jgi:hypothetical protein